RLPLQDRVCSNFSAAASAFFLRAQWRELDVTFFPGFLASLILRATYKLKQTGGEPAKIDIVARCKSFRLRHKTVGIHSVQNQLPFEMFLAGQNKRDRFIMRVD